MDNPVKEIAGVIKSLTQGDADEQKATLNEYFLPNASFTHPFCHVPSFSKGALPLASGIDSLWMILGIYRWYRTLSPHIDIKVDSVAFDQRSGLIYVSLRQTFAVWFIPLYKAPVRLVSVLQLTQKTIQSAPSSPTRETTVRKRNSLPRSSKSPPTKTKYFIASQEDLYPVSDCLQFLLPGLGPLLWFFWQLYSTWLCVMGSLIFLPLYLFLNKGPKQTQRPQSPQSPQLPQSPRLA